MLLLGLHYSAGLGHSHIHRLCHRPTYLPTPIADVFPMAGKSICVLDIGLLDFLLIFFVQLLAHHVISATYSIPFYSQLLPLHFFTEKYI